MSTLLTVDDLAPYVDISGQEAKAQAMVEDVLAQAFAPDVAPCLASATDPATVAAARSILRGIVLRWHETGFASYSAYANPAPGAPVDSTRERRNMMWPSEESKLRALCSPVRAGRGRAFSLDLAPPAATFPDASYVRGW